MKRVTSLGGVFFKADDPKKMNEWYARHLGLQTDEYGTSFAWRNYDDPNKRGFTAWSAMSAKTDYLNPSKKEFMINYRVENLEKLLAVLKEEGVEVVGEIQEFEYGKFGWIMDPEGNKIELWEADDEEYAKILKVVTK
jgi:predicted enzyme related to lactoylglutathione lyase